MIRIGLDYAMSKTLTAGRRSSKFFTAAIFFRVRERTRWNERVQIDRIAKFRKLHETGCFVIPNPWDRGTTIALEHLGYAALATTSAGFGFSLGIPDSVGTIPRDTALHHIRDIVEGTSLPVSADFQEGFARSTEELFENVRLCVATGVAGLSNEDATGDSEKPLFDREIAIERVRAARAAIDSTGIPALLTARCEAWLVGSPAPF
jgi:2-methylisocitrate lyase-like PEP mutase family enzyme